MNGIGVTLDCDRGLVGGLLRLRADRKCPCEGESACSPEGLSAVKERRGIRFHGLVSDGDEDATRFSQAAFWKITEL